MLKTKFYLGFNNNFCASNIKIYLQKFSLILNHLSSPCTYIIQFFFFNTEDHLSLLLKLTHTKFD